MISIKNTKTKRVVRVSPTQAIRAVSPVTRIKPNSTVRAIETVKSDWEYATRDQWRKAGKQEFDPKLDVWKRHKGGKLA